MLFKITFKRPTPKGIAFSVVILLLAAVFTVSAINIVKIVAERRSARLSYGKLQSELVSIIDSGSNDGSESEKAPASIDFNALLKINTDVVGWLYSADTPISYPVVQSDDNSFYLYKGLDKSYLVSGTLFADYRSSPSGGNYIIYGHHMLDGSMLTSIVKYKNQSYYDEHPIMYYLTPDGDYRIELVGGLTVRSDSPIYSAEPDRQLLAELLYGEDSASTFKSDVRLSEEDTVITMSTCTYEFDNARYVLIGKLIRL